MLFHLVFLPNLQIMKPNYINYDVFGFNEQNIQLKFVA